MNSDPLQEISQRVSAYEKAMPMVKLAYKDVVLKYLAVNELTLWRVKTLGSKEPMTINWIEKFPSGSVFYDVGANVGMYTIFAAVFSKARVFAFEPESQNYALLNQNIMLNKVHDRVFAYNIALSDQIQVDRLYLSDVAIGGGCHSFAKDVEFNLEARKSVFQQGSIAMPLDQVIALGKLPTPEYLKIDVDGFEHLVCAGAKGVLASTDLKEICIELNLNLPEHRDIIAQFDAAGFEFDQNEAEKAARRSGFFQGVGEFFFHRKQPQG